MAELNPISTNHVNNTQAIGLQNPRGNLYNDPQGLTGSVVPQSIGYASPESAFYTKVILADTVKKRKFSKLADTITMPRNAGQRIRARIEIPVLDDRNLNDQGIDARGIQTRNGNFYGSSRDIGKILGTLPYLTEEGGRVNRFGFSRAETEGTFNQFGIFFEYSRNLELFDPEKDLVARMHRQAIETAEDITEKNLQIDLLHGAGTVVYAGNAISDETMDETSIITYQTLVQLRKALVANRTPQRTKYITGSGNYGTKVASAHFNLFVGQEVLSVLETLRDSFGDRAFIRPEEYGASIGEKFMEDEVGVIAGFRVILVHDMLGWYGAGADANPNFGLSQDNGKYNIFPALTIGEDAFTCISFEGSTGVNNKFRIKHKKPDDSADRFDPYGTMGFVSIMWWYGIMFKRPERIGLIKTVGFN